MASAFRAKGRGAKLRYVAGLSAAERTALASVLGEVLQIVAPQALAQSEAPAPDAFGSIVAQLGPLGEVLFQRPVVKAVFERRLDDGEIGRQV